eukprot:755168-Hanusia_phi.AAC.2
MHIHHDSQQKKEDQTPNHLEASMLHGIGRRHERLQRRRHVEIPVLCLYCSRVCLVSAYRPAASASQTALVSSSLSRSRSFTTPCLPFFPTPTHPNVPPTVTPHPLGRPIPTRAAVPYPY